MTCLEMWRKKTQVLMNESCRGREAQTFWSLPPRRPLLQSGGSGTCLWRCQSHTEHNDPCRATGCFPPVDTQEDSYTLCLRTVWGLTWKDQFGVQCSYLDIITWRFKWIKTTEKLWLQIDAALLFKVKVFRALKQVTFYSPLLSDQCIIKHSFLPHSHTNQDSSKDDLL